MAIPKVFISSTCFDLGEVREQLKRFVKSFGFEPILSEHGDVFYHPDLHTHESCVHEVSNCQLFILIIGGRFGGSYTSDKSKSITNAEYDAAKASKIPVFTYIRKNVLGNHHIYKENKNADFANQINYPAIDKQKDSENIFKFIDDVRRSPVNNAFEGFDSFNDIEEHLKKQWAGMFYDFLKTREINKQIDVTNHLINSLQGSSSKLEDLVKSFYIETAVDKEKTESSISNIEVMSNIRGFYGYLNNDDFLSMALDPLIGGFDIKEIAKVNPSEHGFSEYLLKTELFLDDSYENEDENEEVLMNYKDSFGFDVKHSHVIKVLGGFYKTGIQASSEEQRLEVLREFID